MKSQFLIFLVILALVGNSLYGQETTITGTVTQASDGSTLPGVTVRVEGTTLGTITDMNGRYEVTAAPNAVLIFSYIGMNTETIPVNNRNVVNVAMVTDVAVLQEIVVTAFGIERERKALSYSVQEVSGEMMAQSGTPNMANALQGKVAGVIVRQSSGMPGSSSHVTIRGSRSFTGNNQPLYVVDGVPVASGAEDDETGGVSGTDFSSRFLDINPEDIENISVLKGPAAAALYGMRATNGVILITTRSGRNLAQGQTQVNFSTNYTFDQVSRTPDLQSTWAQGSYGSLNQGTSLSWGPAIENLGTYQHTILGEQVDGTGQIYDNVSPFFQTGGTLNLNLDASGAGAYGNYSLGIGNTQQTGIIDGTGMQRTTAKLAGNFNINERLTIGGNANFSTLHIDKLPGGSNLSNPLFTVYAAPPSFDLWGLPYADPADPYRQYHYRGAMDNPRWAMANNEFFEETQRVFGNINASFRILDGLRLNYRLGSDYYLTDGKEVYERGSGFTGGRTAVPSGGQIRDFAYSRSEINSNVNLVFNTSIMDDIALDLLLGNEFFEINRRTIENIGRTITIGGFRNMNNTGTQTVFEEVQRERTVGFFGQLGVAWRSTLFVNVTGRNDVVSFMPEGNRSFFYPSVGLGFAFTELLDLPESGLTFGKIRASWAQVGQGGPLYSTQNIFIQGGSGHVGGFLGPQGIQFPFNNVTGFTRSNILRSPDLVPQNTNTTELGFDLRFVNNRIGLDYTFYLIDVQDQIFSVPVPSSTGFTSELRNAGRLETRGHEIMLNLVPFRNNQFEWDVTVNFSTFNNEVLELAPGVTDIFLGGFVQPNVRAQANASYPVIFGTRFLRDDNGNIVNLDDPESFFHGMPIADPEAGVIGKVQPDFEMSLANRLRYGNFNLSFQLDWRQGGQMYAGNTRLLKLYGMDAVTEDRTNDFIASGVKGYLNDEGELVVTGNNDIVLNTYDQFQDYWVDAMDAIDESNVYETTFIRLRELTLTYDIPRQFLQTIGLSRASVFLTGRNLFLITDYPNFDPETSTGGAGNFQGLEYVALPQTRSFGLGLRVTF
jgi:TonB-linked SusC/RagA family outer membrane protein